MGQSKWGIPGYLEITTQMFQNVCIQVPSDTDQVAPWVNPNEAAQVQPWVNPNGEYQVPPVNNQVAPWVNPNEQPQVQPWVNPNDSQASSDGTTTSGG